DTIAWNTVATGGTTSTGTEILPTEGTKVGVALATGPLDIVKITSGDGAASWAPDEFTVQVLCTAGDDDEVVYDEVLTVEADEQVRIDDLPWGSTCVLTEEEDVNGEWDS